MPSRCGGCNNIESNCQFNFKTCSNCKAILGITTRIYGIADECNLYCKLNNYNCKLFLDTGVQVSLLLKDWQQKNISKFEILDLREWGNSTNIPFFGWVNL